MAPQKPEDAHTKGDKIEAHIGKRAQNVAVCKNIIQIITSLPRWLGISLLLSVLVVASTIAVGTKHIADQFNATATPVPIRFAPAGKDETLVVVADFRDPTNVDVRDVTAD